MDRHELLERYEALGEEDDFLEARPLYQRALADSSTVSGSDSAMRRTSFWVATSPTCRRP
jgi:hypothetical protein